jgi:hypothetical protein
MAETGPMPGTVFILASTSRDLCVEIRDLAVEAGE